MTSKIYLITTPDITATFIGSIQPSLRPGFVWICTPSGKPIFEVEESCVKESTEKEFADRLMADKRAAKKNHWN